MTSIKKCLVVNCKNLALKSFDFCFVHRKLNLKSKVIHENELCAICLENDPDKSNFYPLSCLHKFHLTCLEQMVDIKCPLCRKEAINLPKSTKKIIAQNRVKRNEEIYNEEKKEIISQYISQEPPIQIQIVYAAEMLMQQGVPADYLPETVDITIQDRNSPRPSFASIYINAVATRLQEILSLDDADDENGSESGDENINEIIDSIMPSIIENIFLR